MTRAMPDLLKRLPKTALLAVGLFVAMGIAGPWLAPFDPNHVDLANVRQGMGGAHWLGTDGLGRDELSRLLTGARTSLVAITMVLAGAILIGSLIGVISGVVGGLVDEILMRITDVGLSVPSLIVALAVLGARGPGYGNMIMALILAWWPAYARLTRVAVVSLRNQPHIEAVRVLGAAPGRVLLRHLLPPAVAPTLVFASGDAGFVALAVATLSFLGLGISPPDSEWGQMLVDGLTTLEQHPALVILPGLALTLTIVGFNLLGEALALDATPRALTRRRLLRRISAATLPVSQPLPPSSSTTTNGRAKELQARPPRPGALLDVRNLSVTLHTAAASVRVVEDISWSVRPGQTIALVGESGCGKTVSALSLIGLLPAGVTGETAGTALLDGVDLLAMSEAELRAVRGRDIGMVFQDPLTAFNPARRIGPQIGESLIAHQKATKRQAKQRVLELLDEVGISAGRLRYDLYPHELSGGMRQRALVAMAIAGQPRVLIADEPTTALDVTMQAQVLDLLQRLQQARNMALVLITHDVGVVAGMADTVAVTYAGRVVEYGPTAAVLTSSDHPYTQGLLASVPDPTVPQGTLFDSLPGLPPDMATLAPGCTFLDRCAHARPSCHEHQSPHPLLDSTHLSACSVPMTERAGTGARQ